MVNVWWRIMFSPKKQGNQSTPTYVSLTTTRSPHVPVLTGPVKALMLYWPVENEQVSAGMLSTTYRLQCNVDSGELSHTSRPFYLPDERFDYNAMTMGLYVLHSPDQTAASITSHQRRPRSVIRPAVAGSFRHLALRNSSARVLRNPKTPESA